LIFSIGISYLISNSLSKNLKIITTNTAKDLILVNETAVIKSLLEKDYWSIYKILNSINKFEIIDSIGFLDEKNHVIAHTNTSKYKISNEFDLIKFDGIEIPLMSNRYKLGTFVIEINNDSLSPFFKHIKENLIISTILAGILSFLIAYFISERILDRLNILVDNANKIKERKWKDIKPIVSKERDEITLFQHSIEIILNQLNDSIISEQKLKIFYHEILESLNELIIFTDALFNIKYENKHHLSKLLIEDKLFKSNILENISKNILKNSEQFVIDFPLKDGKTIYLHTIIKEVDNGYAFSFSDITILKMLEEKHCFTNSFELMGEISTGVVHEIKNYLQPLKLLVDQEELDSEDKNRIINIISKTDNLVNGFLKTSKPVDKSLSQELNIYSLVEQVLFIFTNKLEQKNIILEKSISNDINIYMVYSDFELIIVNLLQNAIEESPINGVIKIEVNRNETHIFIKISDNGKGINKEEIKNISKPFFTTKEHGSGIGLYTTYKTVYLYDGYINVQSIPGNTSFTINLPHKGK
jgi:signal transduction histidine kinase